MQLLRGGALRNQTAMGDGEREGGLDVKFNTFQGCALRAPRYLRRLTFAFGRPDKLTFFHVIFTLGILDLIVWNLWAPCNFFRAQPCIRRGGGALLLSISFQKLKKGRGT